MPSLGSVVAECSQHSIRQQSACTEGLRPPSQQQGSGIPQLSPHPKGRGKTIPIIVLIPDTRQESRLARAFGACTQMNILEYSGSASCSWTNAKSPVPQSDPSYGKSQVSQNQNKADAQRTKVLELRYLLTLRLNRTPPTSCLPKPCFLLQMGFPGTRKQERVTLAPKRNL